MRLKIKLCFIINIAKILYNALSHTAVIIILFACISQNLIAEDIVFIDDFVSAEAPIDAQMLGYGNVDFNDTRNPAHILNNPAMLSQAFCHSFTFNQTAMIMKASYSSLFYTRPFFRGGLGFAYLSMALDNTLFKETDELGFIIKNNFNISQKAMIAAYGQPIKLFKKNMNIGGSLRILSYNIGNNSLSGFSLLTTLNYKLFNKFSVSHSIANITGGSIGSDAASQRYSNSRYF